MKKGYYIHFQGRASIGISKKLDMQIEEFKKHFDFEEIEVETIPRTLIQRVFGLLPWMSIARGYDAAFEKLDNPDFIYVRRAVAERKYVEFFKRIKEKYPNCKIIIEIFTYPYDKDDFGRWDAWPFYFKELIYRRQLKRYIDRFVTYSQDEEIFGISTIRTGNGVNVDKVVLPCKTTRTENEINLIAVAFMQKHHGYERIIQGIADYVKNKGERTVLCHLIGDGPDKVKYEEQVKRLNLQDYVFFYGTKSGSELDNLYEKGDIALSSLAWYKDGINRDNTIKSREYLAKGFPMISCCKVDRLEQEYPFVFQCPNDSTSIDIGKVVEFWDGLNAKYTNVEMQTMIRNKAREIADMPVVMKPIFDFINA